MVSTEQSHATVTALLSAANVTGDDKIGAAGLATALAGGAPLLSHQMAALRNQGVTRFLVEVDSVPGALLTLADKFRVLGCNVDFVRSAADLQQSLGQGSILVIQSEALYISPHVLGSILAEQGPFIATVDGRDENAAFERMDLNTRWAGLAVIGSATVSSLGALPDGWSMTSSLLRQAMQDRVRFLALPQQNIQTGDVCLISTIADAEQLSRQILANRGSRHSGFIETRILGPIAARLAPYIWQSPSGPGLIDGSTMALGGVSLGLSVMGWHISAIFAAILAVGLNCLRAVTRDPEQNIGLLKWVETILWLLLAAAAILAASEGAGSSGAGLFAALIMTGLALLAQQLNLPVWAQYVLKSPALLALTALVITPLAGFAQAAQWISLAQLGALIVAKWSPKLTRKKGKQA
jgi:hypothetical protein